MCFRISVWLQRIKHSILLSPLFYYLQYLSSFISGEATFGNVCKRTITVFDKTTFILLNLLLMVLWYVNLRNKLSFFELGRDVYLITSDSMVRVCYLAIVEELFVRKEEFVDFKCNIFIILVTIYTPAISHLAALLLVRLSNKISRTPPSQTAENTQHSYPSADPRTFVSAQENINEVRHSPYSRSRCQQKLKTD